MVQDDSLDFFGIPVRTSRTVEHFVSRWRRTWGTSGISAHVSTHIILGTTIMPVAIHKAIKSSSSVLLFYSSRRTRINFDVHTTDGRCTFSNDIEILALTYTRPDPNLPNRLMLFNTQNRPPPFRRRAYFSASILGANGKTSLALRARCR